MSKRHSGWWHERIEFTEGSGLEASQTPKPVLWTSVLGGPTGMPQQPLSPRLTPRQGQLSLPQLLKAAPCPVPGGEHPIPSACWCPDVSPNPFQQLFSALLPGRPGAALGPPWSPTHSLPASVYPHARLTDPWVFFHPSCLPGATFILSLDLNSAHHWLHQLSPV